MIMFSRIANRGLAALILLATPGLIQAAEKTHVGSPLISQEKLQERLDDPNIRILDARPRADYDQGHIPGAVWVDIKAIQALAKPAAIKDEAAWANALEPLGISETTRAVYIYDSARQHDAARVWWSLAYAGVPHVGLVDGGFSLWQKENRPVRTESPSESPSRFRPRLREESLAAREDVRKGDSQILDARASAEYSGEQKPKDGKTAAGHIPGARNLDGYSIVDADGRFLDKDAIHKKFIEAGFVPDRPVIAYSQSGNRSAIAVFALERAGIPIRHYVPGLTEWSGVEHERVVSGFEPGK